MQDTTADIQDAEVRGSRFQDYMGVDDSHLDLASIGLNQDTTTAPS